MNGPKQKLVNVDEVSVSTLSVEIKTVSVGRRQMSMALFRQLPREPLIDDDDDDLRLNGMPWGRVNYHWDGCFHPVDDESHVHVHVLWQRDNVLFQSAVSLSAPFLCDYIDAERDWNSVLASHCRIGVLIAGITTNEEIKSQGNKISTGRWVASEDYQESFAYMLQQFRHCPATAKVENCARIEKKIAELCRDIDVDPPDTEEAAWTRLQDHNEQYRAMRTDQTRHLARYQKRYEELLALEQLFISA